MLGLDLAMRTLTAFVSDPQLFEGDGTPSVYPRPHGMVKSPHGADFTCIFVALHCFGLMSLVENPSVLDGLIVHENWWQSLCYY